MSSLVSRRSVLQSGLAAAGALACGTWTLPAAEPIVRTGKSHLKLSLAAYSFRQFLQGDKATMTMDDFVAKCAEYQVDGAELTSYYFPSEVTEEYLLHLKELTFRYGLDISGTAIGNNFCLPAGPQREAQLDLCRRWVDHAAAMGAPVIRIFAGQIPNGSTETEALERCVEGINQSVEYAAKKGVALALENHGGITATADQLLDIVRRVEPSPWFGINFDSGNFHTEDPYGDLARIAPYTLNAQIKTEMSVNKKKEEADLPRIVKILKDSGYRGYVVLEYEAAEDPLVAIPRHLETLRSLIA